MARESGRLVKFPKVWARLVKYTCLASYLIVQCRTKGPYRHTFTGLIRLWFTVCKVKSLDSVQAHSQKFLLGSSDFGDEATSLWFKTNWCMCVRSYCFYFKIILHSSNTVEYHAHKCYTSSMLHSSFFYYSERCSKSLTHGMLA